MSRESPNREYLLAEYRSRINRVIDYIEANIGSELSLKELAGVAHFSPFHFHRIFGAMVGETLNGFIQRLRIEKAASMLVQNPKQTITGIALDCGFSSSSVFARAFKDNFGMSASDWRRKIGNTDSKMSQAGSNLRQDFEVAPSYTRNINKLEWRVTMKESNLKTNVEVRDIPEMHVAYVRHVGPYAGDVQLFERLFNKLCAWAGPRGLLQSPDAKFINIYHDNPDITDDKKLRMDVCVTVPPDTQVDGEIGKAVIPAGKNAIAHFEINADQFGDAWNAVYGGWFPESGYQPDDRPCFELCLNSPKDHPEGKHIVDIYAPVKPL
jgi:AraC family transcriptional regulator